MHTHAPQAGHLGRPPLQGPLELTLAASQPLRGGLAAALDVNCPKTRAEKTTMCWKKHKGEQSHENTQISLLATTTGEEAKRRLDARALTLS